MPAEIWFIAPNPAGSMAVELQGKWSDALRWEFVINPCHVDLDRGSQRLPEILDGFRTDSRAIGVVVTTFKLAAYQALGAMPSLLTPRATSLREVNVVRKTGDYRADASDFDTALQILDLLPAASSSYAVCLGGGGAGLAIVDAIVETGRFANVVLCERDQARSAVLRRHYGKRAVHSDTRVDVIGGKSTWDLVVSNAPEGSLIINATGLGKFDERMPVTDLCAFSPGSTVWDLNYRGPMPFLDLAKRHHLRSRLFVEDGWRMFARGWLNALEFIHGSEFDNDRRHRFLTACKR